MPETVISVITRIPWGGETEAPQPNFAPRPAGGLALPDAPQHLQAGNVMVRADDAGNIWLLESGGRRLMQYDGQGNRLRVVSPQGLSTPITAFAAVGDALYFMAHAPGAENWIGSLAPDGAMRWAKAIPANLVEAPGALVVSGDRVWISSQRELNALFEFDAGNGEFLQRHHVDQAAKLLGGLPDGRLVLTGFFPEENRRGLIWYDPSQRTATQQVAGKEVYGLLASVIGVDAAGNVLAHGQTLGGTEAAIFQLGPDGNVRDSIPMAKVEALLESGPTGNVLPKTMPFSQWAMVRQGGVIISHADSAGIALVRVQFP